MALSTQTGYINHAYTANTDWELCN